MFRPSPAFFIAASFILICIVLPAQGQATDSSGTAANAPLNLNGDAEELQNPDAPEQSSESSVESAPRKTSADPQPILSPVAAQATRSSSKPLPPLFPVARKNATDSPSTPLGSGTGSGGGIASGGGGGGELWRVGIALSIVLAALFGLRLLLRKMGGMPGGSGRGRPSGVMEILARYPVARGQQLILLKIARRVLLVHQNGTAMSTLSEMIDEDEVADLLRRVESGSRKTTSGGFRSVMERFNSDHQTAAQTPETNAGDHPGSLNPEIIDLTKNQDHSFMRLLGRKGSAR